MPDDITQLIARARQTDDAAAAAIWDAYFDNLTIYARRKLAAMPRRSVDEEDVVLSAMNSFFDGAKKGKFQPRDRDELWKLLATITVRKATAQLRKHYAKKRGGGDVRGESVFMRPGDASENFGIDQVLDDKQLPEMSLKLAGTCEEMLEQLGDDSLRRIALMRLEGFSNDEIATELNVSLATVKRKLKRIREAWTSEPMG